MPIVTESASKNIHRGCRPWGVLPNFPGARRLVGVCVFLFWCTALLAVPYAYAPSAALIKFSLLSAGTLLFLAIQGRNASSTARVAPVFALIGAGVALLFLLVHDWKVLPADFGWINRAANGWMAVRPGGLAAAGRSARHDLLIAAFLGPGLNQNVAGGLLAALLPFAGLWLIEERRRPLRGWADAGLRALALCCAAVMAFGLLLSSSRAAMAALAAALALWAAWRAGARLPHSFRRWRMPGLLAGLAVLAILAGAALARWGAVIALLNHIPGFPSAASRSQLVSGALRLVVDFPILGAGLKSFPGLYSVYIQGIPYYIFGYSHNLYLDVAIEQGLPGLLALMGVLVFSLRAAVQAGDLGAGRRAGRLGQAAFIGLIVLALHGLADDPFYGEYGTPLLFILPGAALCAARASKKRVSGSDDPHTWGSSLPKPARYGGGAALSTPAGRQRRAWVAPVAALLAAVLCGALVGRSLASLWMSNLGAVKMAQVQLADFPSGRWDERLTTPRLDAAEAFLRRAAAWNPANRSANQRLGLIAAQRWDFEAACPDLQRAYAADPGHRGVVKNLGYCLTWLGRYSEAALYLQRIPEARQELEVYAGWWAARSRPDLARHAETMRKKLAKEVQP